MKIWHIGSSFSPKKVDGINNTVWIMAREQALLGHQVALLLDTPPDKAALVLAEQAGFELIHVPASTWRYEPKVLEPLLHSTPPHVVHMHSVFLPKQATLANNLIRNKIPYVITPNGGLDSRRGRAKKILYSLLAEKRRFSAASVITVVTPKEAKTVRAFVPLYRGIVRWVANPVEDHNLEGQSWQGNTEAKHLVYLGRFDVLHKGIDILVDIARLLPDVKIHLYGTEEPKTKGWLKRLQHNCPPNIYFHNPVFGVEKFQVLAAASLYIQTARWEGFPLSIAEAMYLGVPCAVTDMPNFAELFHQNDLGLVLPSNPREAAIRLTEVLAQPARLGHWSERAQAFAKAHFHPRTVALEYLKLYEEVFRV